MFHSDRGSQNTSRDFTGLLAEHEAKLHHHTNAEAAEPDVRLTVG